MKHIANILIGTMLIFACGSSNSGNNTVSNNESNEVSANMDEWLGYYIFRDVLDRRYTDYFLTIYKEHDAYYAVLKTWGYQLQTNVKAKLKTEGQSAELLFEKFLPDNEFDYSCEAGEVVLNLEKRGGNLFVKGGKIMILGGYYENPDTIYFKPSPDYVGDAAWCETPGLTLPQINTGLIDNEYVTQCNREIRELYDRFKKDYDDFLKERIDDSGHGPEASYRWAVTGDILSIMITHTPSGWAVPIDRYDFFNLNIKTGQPVDADALILSAGITREDIKTAIERANNSNTEGVLHYKDEYEYRKMNMYLGKEGLELFVLYTLNQAAENSEYITSVLISKWLNARTTDMTMNEAVDILSKKLNDRTLKYLLGDENESIMVEGEKTHYIRAYHESLDGESIATLGHFYIGRQSKKIYIMDVIMGTDIIPYDDYLKKYDF